MEDRFTVFARLAVAQAHEIGEQVGNGVVPVAASANLELPDCGLGRFRTVIVLAVGIEG